MKAAKPVEKDNKNHHSQSKKQKAKKPVVVSLPVTEVAPLQTQKPEESAVLAGFATPNINKTNANGIIAPVHGSQTIYDQGSGIMFKKHQESMAETGDINHPDTQKAEKDYISTLNISQVKDYHDLKSGTYVPKTLEEQADNNKTKSRETVPEFILQADGDDKKKKNKGANQENSNERVESHLIKIKPNQHYEGKLISSDEQLDRFAESQMKLTRKLNWGKLGEDFIQKLVKTGGTINYSISLKNEVVAQEIADLSEDKKSFLQNTDSKLQSLVLLDLLKELSPAEVADFKSKTTAESSNSKDIENSLRKYIKDRNLRKKENDKRESITNSLTGNSMIDVYHKYKAYQKSQKVVDDWHKNPKHERAVPDNLLENAHSDFSIFEQAAKAMGYTTTEFIKLINQYEIAFRKETVHIAEDGLQKYRHTLFEQKKKLLDDAFLTNLLAKIKASKAKESYKEASRASAGASGMAFAERPTDKDRSFGQEMKALAISKKTEGNNAIGSLSSTTPLVQENGFDKEGLANIETKEELRNFLANYISDQEANITRIIKNLHADQGLSIYGYANLLEKSKEQQGIAKDSIFDLIIADKESEESTRHIIEGLLIGVLAVALGLLTFGTGTVAVLLAAGVSAYLTYEEIETYRTQLAAYKVNISEDEPSAVWVIIAVVGSVLDIAAVAKISSKLVKAGRVFEESKSINQTRKILTEADLDPATQEKVIKALKDDLNRAKAALKNKIKENTIKHTELKVDIKESLNKAKNSAFTTNVFVNPEFATKLRPLAGKYIKSGVLSFEKFLLELQAAKIIKEIDKLSSEELSLLRKTFEDAKSLAKENDELADVEKGLGDNDISTMREIEKNAGDILAQNIIKGLRGKGISQDIIDQIIIRSKYIDAELRNTKMSEILDYLSNNPKFKNPEDLLENLDGCFTGNTVKSDRALSLLNEFLEGKYWMERGERVIISKKLTPGKTPDNEVDVIIITGANKGIIECKRPNVTGANSENNVYANLQLILKKFNSERKLTQQWKDIYPKKFGQIEIANGAFTSLNTAEEFVKAVKNKGIIGTGDGKMFTLSELKSLEELHILVNDKRIIVKPNDW